MKALILMQDCGVFRTTACYLELRQMHIYFSDPSVDEIVFKRIYCPVT